VSNIDSDSKLIDQLQVKMNYYENQINSGIFFKLESGKEPSEIFGVLDFLKYKFKKWQRTSIFSYYGDLFSGVNILIVGTESIEEARTILHFVYFKELIESEDQIIQLKTDSIEQLDLYLEKEFINNLNVGYPANRKLEQEIQTHLVSLINDNS
jgi:hypothetical protein